MLQKLRWNPTGHLHGGLWEIRAGWPCSSLLCQSGQELRELRNMPWSREIEEVWKREILPEYWRKKKAKRWVTWVRRHA